MLAVLYLFIALLMGDTVARPLAGHGYRPRRIATAFLVGLLVMSWLTYLGGLLFASFPNALDLGNLLSLGVAVVVVAARLARGWSRGAQSGPAWLFVRPNRSEALDWIVIAGIALFFGWMSFATYGYEGGELKIAGMIWSDFGPTTAIAQSFAEGHNFPTQYPHFAGPPILYHFLFYFQVGNLTHLGFDPAMANNVLSIASVAAMLTLVIAIGRQLLRSATVGRLGAVLFFFHGSLSFVAYLSTFASPADALAAVWSKATFLVSGFPYRGEEWGIWTQVVFLNQRHLASAIGILLVAVLFVLDRQVSPSTKRTTVDDAPSGVGPALKRLALAVQDRLRQPRRHVWAGLTDPALPGYLSVGFLLGLLPLWNGPLFVASGAVFATLFLMLPNRTQMACVAIAAGLVALPQLIALRPMAAQTAQLPAFHWGYVVDNPTLMNVIGYLGFTFGPKVLLAGIALLSATRLQRRIFVAFTGLVAVAFLVQLSVEIFGNHKFLNVWLVILNLFAAKGLVRLWSVAGRGRMPAIVRRAGRALAVVMIIVITAGGVIDLMPIKNTSLLGIRLAGDRLYDWVIRETRGTDVFLTDRYVVHRILLAGRPIYFGWPYYAWSAGYPVDAREQIFRRIVGGTDAAEVVRLLQQERIAYVAIDDGLRRGDFVKSLNEPLFAANFETVFTDPDGRNGHIVIYKVPVTPVATTSGVGPAPVTPAAPTSGVGPAPVTMYLGGKGSGPGRFDAPRGIAVTPSGEVLVADADNHRIQRFSPNGDYLGAFGAPGTQLGQFNQPNGVAVDSRGRIYVADTTNHRIQEFDASGRAVRDWRGPADGFYGPRDVVVGSGDILYVLDQGRGRVVTLAPDGAMTTIGRLGSGAILSAARQS